MGMQKGEGMKIEENKLLESVLNGRIDFFRSGAMHSPLAAATFKQDANGLAYYVTGMDYAPLNGILESDAGRIPSAEEINKAKGYFAGLNLPFIWWSAATILEQSGFINGGILTAIAMDISGALPQLPKRDSQLRIRVAANEADLQAFTNLAIDGFCMKPNTLEPFKAINGAGMKADELVHFIAYSKDFPVGIATLSTFPKSAGVWNLMTLPDYRRHGVGGALVYEALKEAKKRHHDAVMAILMPKGMAWGLFTRLGFEEVCKFPFYVYGVGPESLEK